MIPAELDMAMARSLALHREVASKLREDPALLDMARRRVSGWLADRTVARQYAEAWQRILEQPVDEIIRAVTADNEQAHDLRQVSPFAGALDPRTRWRILRAFRPKSR